MGALGAPILHLALNKTKQTVWFASLLLRGIGKLLHHHFVNGVVHFHKVETSGEISSGVPKLVRQLY